MCSVAYRNSSTKNFQPNKKGIKLLSLIGPKLRMSILSFVYVYVYTNQGCGIGIGIGIGIAGIAKFLVESASESESASIPTNKVESESESQNSESGNFWLSQNIGKKRLRIYRKEQALDKSRNVFVKRRLRRHYWYLFRRNPS